MSGTGYSTNCAALVQAIWTLTALADDEQDRLRMLESGPTSVFEHILVHPILRASRD
jgi:hypothetical protein